MANREVYFEGFEKGFDALYPRSVSDLIGNDYARLRPVLKEAIEHRNKIFHGQLTSKSLSTDDLLAYVRDIRAWCEALADNAHAEIGYDGFARESFRKSANQDLARRLKVQFRDVGEYADFIRNQMQRPRQRRRP